MSFSQADFVSILQQLNVADNGIRQGAERTYAALKAGSETAPHLPSALLQTIGDPSVPPHIRQLAAVLLRRLLVEEEPSFYRSISSEGQAHLRAGLLHILRAESDRSLKLKVCDIVGELAGLVLEPSEWPEIIPCISEFVKSTLPVDREVGISLFGMVSESRMETLLASPESVQGICSIFFTSFSDGSNEGRILTATMRAFASFALSVRAESDLDHFQPLMPAILGALQRALQLPPSESCEPSLVATQFTEYLIAMVEERAPFFGPQLGAVFDAMMSIVERPDVPATLRHMLIEFLVSLSYSAPKIVRKLKSATGEQSYFVIRFVPLLVRMLASVAEDPHWHLTDAAEDFSSSEGMSDSAVGETALDRFAQAMGLRSTFATMSAQLVALFTTPAWQAQYAGLMCMGNYLEVTAKIPDKAQLQQHREEVISTLSAFATNSHPRVRNAALYAMCQLVVQHGKSLRNDQLERLLQVMLANCVVSCNSSPRVRRTALSGLTNLIDIAPTLLLEAQTDAILRTVTSALSEGPVLVQEACVSAITSLAESVKGQQLARHYDTMMPILKQLLTYSQSRGLETLWGSSIECCAMLGEASGKITFYTDAMEMMAMLVQVQQQLEEGSDVRKYLMKAWVRIARCLGAEFLPFLKVVMDNLLAAMTQDLTSGTGDVDLDDIDERSDIDLVETEEGWVAVRTAAVEEQASACQLVFLLAEKLQEHFYPYVEQTIRAISPLLKSPHDDVRSYCMVSLGELVRSVGKASAPDRGPAAQLGEYALGLLVSAVQAEETLEFIMTGLQSMKLVLQYLCTDWAGAAAAGLGMQDPPSPTPSTCLQMLNPGQMEAIVQCAKQVLRDSIQRRAVLRAQAQVLGNTDEDDIDDENLFMSESLELHYNVSEVLGVLFRTHGPAFMPVYSASWHDTVTEMGHPHCLKEDRQFAFYVISDVIEFGLGGETTAPYLAQVLPVLCEACRTMPAASPRQACAYSLGIAAEKHPAEFAMHATPALQVLGACIAMGEDAGEPRGQCTDNAVSSVGVILEQMEAIGLQGLPYAALWGQWLAYLPLRHDDDECRRVTRQLLRLLSRQHPNLFSGSPSAGMEAAEQHSRVAQGIRALLQVMSSEASTMELDQDIAQVVKAVCSSVGDAFVQQLVESDGSLRSKIEKARTCGARSDSSPLGATPIHDLSMRR